MLYNIHILYTLSLYRKQYLLKEEAPAFSVPFKNISRRQLLLQQLSLIIFLDSL